MRLDSYVLHEHVSYRGELIFTVETKCFSFLVYFTKKGYARSLLKYRRYKYWYTGVTQLTLLHTLYAELILLHTLYNWVIFFVIIDGNFKGYFDFQILRMQQLIKQVLGIRVRKQYDTMCKCRSVILSCLQIVINWKLLCKQSTIQTAREILVYSFFLYVFWARWQCMIVQQTKVVHPWLIYVSVWHWLIQKWKRCAWVLLYIWLCCFIFCCWEVVFQRAFEKKIKLSAFKQWLLSIIPTI